MWSDRNLLLIYLSFHLSGLLTSDQKEPTVLRPHFFIVFLIEQLVIGAGIYCNIQS